LIPILGDPRLTCRGVGVVRTWKILVGQIANAMAIHVGGDSEIIFTLSTMRTPNDYGFIEVFSEHRQPNVVDPARWSAGVAIEIGRTIGEATAAGGGVRTISPPTLQCNVPMRLPGRPRG
jgi:hypothetical protein